jgi:hypothetical protein
MQLHLIKTLVIIGITRYKNGMLNSSFGIQRWNPQLEFVSSFIITTKVEGCNEQNSYSSLDSTGISTINNITEIRHQNSKGDEKYIMTSSKQASDKVLEPLAIVVPSKKRKIILAILIVAVSLSVAIEIGFASSLQQGYVISANSYKHSLCEEKILDLSQKGVIGKVSGFSGAIYECVHMQSANSIYGDMFSTLKM